MLTVILMYLGVGAIAGVLAGLLGVGGGLVIVPMMVFTLTWQAVPPEHIMHLALGTSLASIIFTSISSFMAHHRRGAVHWATVFRLAPGILAGSVLGSILAEDLPIRWFRVLFAVFLLHVGGRLLTGTKVDGIPPLAAGVWRFSLAGLVIGAVSSILGIGGGTLSVPFLVRCRYSIRNAVAISSACGFPLAVAGTSTYIALGWQKASLPPWSLGYVYLPAFAGIILTSVPLAPFGAYLAHRFPTARLRRIFALFVIVLGGKLLWQAAEPWIRSLP